MLHQYMVAKLLPETINSVDQFLNQTFISTPCQCSNTVSLESNPLHVSLWLTPKYFNWQ